MPDRERTECDISKTFYAESDRRMAKWAVVECFNFPLIGSVFARATHPELIVQQRSTGHDACRELEVTVWADLAPGKVKRNVIKLH